MVVITADIFNVYIRSSVPTKLFVKLLFSLINLSILTALFCLAISVQDEKPAPWAFLFPIVYFFTFGKYLIWNVFGIENIILNPNHVSYQHSYGLWKSKLKTLKYDFIEARPIDETLTEGEVKLVFGAYQKETKLPEIIFQTAIPISFNNYISVFNLLGEIQVDEFSSEKGFPKIFNN